MIFFDNLARLLYISRLYGKDDNFRKQYELLSIVGRELSKPIDITFKRGIIEDEKRYNHNHDPKTGKFTSAPIGSSGIDNSEKSDTSAGFEKISNFNNEFLSIIEKEFGKLQTNEIILRDERVIHVKQHHLIDFDYFKAYRVKVTREPDLIIKDCKNIGTIFMAKKLGGGNVVSIIRLALSTDEKGYKNSMISFFRMRDRNLKKLRNKNKVLYNKD